MEELNTLSNATVHAVAQAAPFVVRVDDGSRLTASGVVWASGIIVSTSHGVERDEDLSVVVHDGTRLAATLVGRDNETDVAVLRVSGGGDAVGSGIARHDGGESVAVGQIALAVARPGDGGLTATLGLVARKIETETNGQAEYIVHTDAVLYPGFSGGALVGTDGKLIGLLNRIYGRGMGVALGSPLINRVVETLLAHGRIPRGYLGIRTQLVSLPENLRTGLSLEQTRGLLIAQVEPASPADKGGLLLGDTLLAINNQPLDDVSDLRGLLHAGQTANLRVLRGGTLTELSVVVGADTDGGR